MFQPRSEANSKAVIEVAEKLLTRKFAWLGINDGEVEGIWKYDSNNFRLEWANWDINEPNNFQGMGSPDNVVIIKKTSGSIILTSNLLLLNESNVHFFHVQSIKIFPILDLKTSLLKTPLFFP